jgi:hypothetical protein
MSEARSEIADVIARAEEFLSGGFITAGRYGPTPGNLRKGGKGGKGRAFEWLCRHVSHNEKKQCLFWPFFKSEGQPGLVGYRGMAFGPVRLMCQLAHGAPPSDRHWAMPIKSNRCSSRLMLLKGFTRASGSFFWPRVRPAI